MVTEPRLRSLGGLGSASRNLRFLGLTVATIRGGVGRWATGSAARTSMGRRSGSGSFRLKLLLLPAVDRSGFALVLSCETDVASSCSEGCLP